MLKQVPNFMLIHKLRQAVAADHAKDQSKGDGEIDGAYFVEHRMSVNYKASRAHCRLAGHHIGKRHVVVVMRERPGRMLPIVARLEDGGVSVVAH